MKKKNFKYTSLSMATIFELFAVPAYSQNATPIGMKQIGSQQYMGQSRTLITPQPRIGIAPTINSIYAQPMNRVNEIPLYGKNKNLYFYNQKKKDEGILAGSGLYMFADFSTGKSTDGINIEHGEASNGESDANDDMGDPNGFSLGVGRVMSNSLSVEFGYTSYNNMKYGDWAKFNTEEEIETDEEDEEGNIVYETVKSVDDNTYEVISGGSIDSQVISVGFKYNLENSFGALLGRLKPYFGFSLGVAQNTLDNYTVTDRDGYIDPDSDELPEANADNAEEIFNNLEKDVDYISTEYYDGELTYIGSTNNGLALSAEVGFSLELEGNLSIDFFYKMVKNGKVKTSGTISSTYESSETVFYKTDAPFVAEDPACPNGGSPYFQNNEYSICVLDAENTGTVSSITQRRVLSGNMDLRQYGIRLKYMF